MRNKFTVENIDKYIRRSAHVLGVDVETAKKHMEVALLNIQAEVDGKELREIGIVPVGELQAILPVFQEAMIDHFSDYVEWLSTMLITQFQNMLTKEINRISELASLKYIKDNGISSEQLEEIMRHPLLRDKVK